MADIELVIKIPDGYDLSKIQNGSIASKIILNAVKRGIPLPKGHGDLVDRDAVYHAYDYSDIEYTMIKALDDAPIIIEADMREEGEAE